jgi:integral membrane protein (TIGR01906 family)
MRKTIVISSIILFFLIFLQSFFSILYDYDFYKEEFVKNNVKEIGKEDMVLNLFNYFEGKENISSEYFNEKERLHLVDVKNLINIASVLYYILLFCLIFSLFYLHKGKKKFSLSLKRIFNFSGLAVIGFTLISVLLQKHFTYFFIKFHEILFSNDLWLLNPKTDVLIRLFPEQFFIDIVSIIFIKSVVFAFVLFGISFILHKFLKRN